MTETEYVAQRLDDQIAWFARKAGANQRTFRLLRIVEISLAALIPVLSISTTGNTPRTILVGALGATIAVIAGLLALYRFQENWIRYRTTREALTREKFLYLAKAPPYERDGAFHVLVQRAEDLMASEHGTWAHHMQASAPHVPPR